MTVFPCFISLLLSFHLFKIRETPIPTPEVTPRHSPVLPSSPVEHPSRPPPALVTPEVTPTSSVMEELQEAAANEKYQDSFEDAG